MTLEHDGARGSSYVLAVYQYTDASRWGCLLPVSPRTRVRHPKLGAPFREGSFWARVASAPVAKGLLAQQPTLNTETLNLDPEANRLRVSPHFRRPAKVDEVSLASP